jgi:uncharacterized protein YndB with AHSA1/START domain
MTMPLTVKVAAQGETDIVITRTFDAPRHLVFEAHTRPELVQRWLLGPDGWTMPVCEIDLRVGGRYRYVWHNTKTGKEMGLGGVFREISPPDRLVHTEKFDEAWYPGEAIITTVFTERSGVTTLTLTMHMASREARDGVLKSGMERGLEASYARLEEMVGRS